MQTTNRYAPPRAEVRDVREDETDADAAPPLWTPNAAASWSLLFTPAFGAWLHMRNWERLGRPAQARQARYWFAAMLLISLASASPAPPPPCWAAKIWSRPGGPRCSCSAPGHACPLIRRSSMSTITTANAMCAAPGLRRS